jgi:hypothetical protein
MTQRSLRQRIAILIGLLILVLILVGTLQPIPQDPGYHLFADSRGFFGIPNFNDVISNIGFTLVGVLGFFLVIGESRRILFARSVDARPYRIFFIAVTLIGVGSAYYHWAPSNERLFWDRLPMAMAFMAITSATIADRIDAKAGNGWLLLLLLAGGAVSLIYWHWTESLGRGDLRPYALVQFYPMLALPVVIALFPRHRYTVGRYLAWVVAWYALSKVLEHFDREVFELLGHTVSGHTLKHLAAALATLVVLRMLSSRTHSHAV